MKNYFKKLSRFSVIIAIAILPLLSIGCSDPEKGVGPVTIKIWKPFVDSDKMQSIMSAYQAKHTNVTFEYTKKNIENYETDLLNALAA